MILPGEIQRIARHGKCYEGVTRKGEYVPCDKDAVAVRLDPDSSEPYPVCAKHARGDMLTLPRLINALVENPS